MEQTVDPASLLVQLRRLIGRHLQYQQQQCQVIEVLEQGPALVLQCDHAQQTIQPNQYGNAHRRVAKTITLPVLEAGGHDFHGDFLLLCEVNEL